MSTRRKAGRAAGNRRAQTEPAPVARTRPAHSVPIDAQALFELVREPLLVLDAELRVQQANPAFCQMFEIAAADVEGQSLFEADRGAWNMPELRYSLEQVFDGMPPGEPLELRHTFQRIGRRVLRFYARRSPGRGGHDHILLAINDLTDRELARASEKRAVERLQRVESLIESLNDAIIEKALDGTITSWNRGAEELFGYTAAEAVGRSMTLICPDDRIDELERFIEQIRRGERVPTFETRRLRKDGREIDVSVAVSPVLDAAGRVVGASAVDRDISRQKEAERNLRESKQRFQCLFEQMQDAILLCNDEGRYVDANPAACALLGQSREELLARTVFDLTPEVSREDGRRLWQKFVQTGKQSGQYAIRGRGGESFTVDYRAVAHVLPGLHMSVLRDVTLQRRAEEALLREHTLRQRLLETIQAVVLTLDPEGRIVWFNGYLEELSGHSLADVRGRDWFETFLPDCDHARIRRVFRGAITGTATRGNINPILTKDGRERLIEWHDVLLTGDDGRMSQLLCTGHDVTEQRQALRALHESEAFSRAVLSSLTAHIAVLDRQGRIVAVNAAWEHFAKQNGDPELVSTGPGMNYLEICRLVIDTDAIAAQALAGIEGVLAGAVREFSLEYPCHSPDRQRWFLMRVTPLLQEGRGGVVVSNLEITQRRQAETALRESEHRFRRLSEQLNLVTDSMSAPVARCSRDLRYLWVSRAYAEWCGSSPEKIVDRPIVDVLGPEAFERIRPHIEAALAGEQVRYEEELNLPGLSHRWVSVAYTPTFDEKGAPDGWVAVVIDIDSRKRAEQALTERVAQQAAVAALSQKMLQDDSLQSLMNEAVRTVAATLGTEYVKVLELLPDQDKLLLRAGIGWEEGLVGRATVGAGQESQGGYTLLIDQPVIVTDLAAETRFHGPQLLHEHGVVSGVSCKICGPGGEPYGVLGAHTTRKREFSDDDLHFLQAIASMLGSTLQRYQARQALRASEQHIRDVLDNLFTFVGVLTPDGTLTEANRAPLEAAGITIEDVRGRKFWECPWWSYNPAVQMRVQAACELAARGTPSRYDVPVRIAGGRLMTIDFMIAPLRDAKGRITHLIPSACDITDRKRAEAALKDSEDSLRAILETAADAIITIDSAGIIQTFNTAAEKMFGYQSEEAVGRNVSLLMPCPYREEHDGYLAAYRWTGVRRMIGSVREFVGQRKDGSRFPVELAVSAIDHRMQFTAIIRDISERKALQEQLLTIAEQEQRRIGQDLHDDVGQELAGLGLLADTLVEALEERSAPETELASRIAVRSQRALHKTRLLSRGLIPVEIDREGLMAALAELASRACGLEHVNCFFECEQPVLVHDNRTATHLYRIAQEAVNNALRHAQAREIRIGLAAGSDLTSLTVTDDGVGIPEEQQERGMGLRIMRYRAHLVGGTLTIGPGPERGTQVACRVPQGTVK